MNNSNSVLLAAIYVNDKGIIKQTPGLRELAMVISNELAPAVAYDMHSVSALFFTATPGDVDIDALPSIVKESFVNYVEGRNYRTAMINDMPFFNVEGSTKWLYLGTMPMQKNIAVNSENVPAPYHFEEAESLFAAGAEFGLANGADIIYRQLADRFGNELVNGTGLDSVTIPESIISMYSVDKEQSE